VKDEIMAQLGTKAGMLLRREGLGSENR